MNIHRTFAIQILSVAIVAVSSCYTSADEITLISVPGYPTGANINALAGELFSSDLDSVDMAGSGMSSASASKDGSLASHASSVELDFSGGDFAFFESTYDSPFSRTAILDHRASAESIFHFAVDEEVVFEVMGSFVVTDDAGTTVPGNVELEIELLEFDDFGMPPEVVFYSYQASKLTMDQSFEVGGMEGDTFNSLVGDPTGILDPSKLYRYRTLVTTNAIDIDGTDPLPATDGGASAMGGHAILFSGFSAVPEPGSAAIIAFVTLPLMVRRRRITS